MFSPLFFEWFVHIQFKGKKKRKWNWYGGEVLKLKYLIPYFKIFIVRKVFLHILIIMMLFLFPTCALHIIEHKIFRVLHVCYFSSSIFTSELSNEFYAAKSVVHFQNFTRIQVFPASSLENEKILLMML